MIRTNALTKRFGSFTALDRVTCAIDSGSVYGMVGSNGAGKSTFLRTVAGVYKQDGGTVTIDDLPVWNSPEAKSKLSLVADEAYYPTGATLTRMASMYGNLFADFDKKRCFALAKDFGLDVKKPLNSFSKGMRRQAMIILALARQTKYLFFDETFDGLDPVMRNHVKSLICEQIYDRGATAIITSHSLRELEDLCDALALLHRGGLVLESDIQNLKTEQFKVQVAFSDDYDKSRFEGLDLRSFTKRGAVSSMVVRGDRAKTEAQLRAMSPLLLEILPLSLEEVFAFEMEALGYVYEGEDDDEAKANL